MTPIVLRPVISVTDAGIPVLQGENRRVIAVQVFSQNDVGRLAACQAVASEDEAVLALGVIEDSSDAASTEPLVLRRGEARLVLAHDGSIRLEGRSLGVRTKGRITFNGATVELN